MKRQNILLINPRTYPADCINTIEDKHPPLGLAYLASFLKNNGFAVSILDMPATNISDSIIGEYVRKQNYTLIGITGMTHQITNGCQLAGRIKKDNPEIVIIFGGVHATFCFEEILMQDDKTVDFVVRGEGELTLLELARALEQESKDFRRIKGLAYFDKVNKCIVTTGERKLISCIDNLPLPARDLLPMHEYFLGETIFGNSMIEIMASRGCPHDCIFCSSPDFWRRNVRFRSMESILNEINFLLQRYPIRYFEFVDDGFTLRKDFLYLLCEQFIKNKLNIRWRCLARVDHVNKEMLILMKKAGCVKICYGVESGNQKILDFENKGISIAQIKKAFSMTHEVGIATLALMIIGHPLESTDSIIDSMKLIREIKPFRYVFQCMSPYVGTRLFNEIVDQTGTILSKKWEDYRSTERPLFVPNGLNSEMIKKYRDEFMLENFSLSHSLRRIFIAFLLVGTDIFNKKFFFKPLYYSLYKKLPKFFQNHLDYFLINRMIPLMKRLRKGLNIFLSAKNQFKFSDCRL